MSEGPELPIFGAVLRRLADVLALRVLRNIAAFRLAIKHHVLAGLPTGGPVPGQLPGVGNHIGRDIAISRARGESTAPVVLGAKPNEQLAVEPVTLEAPLAAGRAGAIRPGPFDRGRSRLYAQFGVMTGSRSLVRC